jgi:hypothetical protein
MKKFTLSVILSFISLLSFSQTFEHQFDVAVGRIFQISENEYIYSVVNFDQRELLIYSMDYNLLKTINLPQDSTTYYFEILNVSKTLFNPDDNFEICYTWWASNGGISNGVKVLNDEGNILLSEDGSIGADFYNTNIGSKMIVNFYYDIKKVKVYNLYGTVLSSGKNLKDNFTGEIYPNPASNNININLASSRNKQNLVLSIYSSDNKLVNNINVLPNQNVISINIEKLNPGLYFYNVHNASYSTPLNKFIVSR